MTYKEIFGEIYKKNKVSLYLMLGLILVSSVFLFYSGTGIVFGSADTFSEADAAILGGSLTSAFFIVANNANIPLAPPVALSCTAILSIWSEFGTLPQQLDNFSFGLLDLWPVRIFVFIWCIVSVLPRCTQVTRIGGMAIEEIDQDLGQLAAVIVTISQVLANFNGSSVANAALTNGSSLLLASSSSGNSVAVTFGQIVLCVILLTYILACFLFIRTFMFFIDIILLPICTCIPLTSATTETVKIIAVVIMYALAIFAPWAYILCYGILLAVSIFLFQKSYTAVQYFKKIYVKPMTRKIFKGYRVDMPLVCLKAPKRLVKSVHANNLRMLIPVYPVQKSAQFLKLKKYDKWWMTVQGDRCILYKCSRFKKEPEHIELIQSDVKKIFIRRSRRFFQVFALENEATAGKFFQKKKKDWHFVFSKEYFYCYGEILSMTGFIDYDEFVAELKQKENLDKPQGFFKRFFSKKEAEAF